MKEYIIIIVDLFVNEIKHYRVKTDNICNYLVDFFGFDKKEFEKTYGKVNIESIKDEVYNSDHLLEIIEI